MNKNDVKALVKEWMHKPPGSRPLLEKAIAEQFRKYREGQWLGLQEDDLLTWLREAVSFLNLDTDVDTELENRVAALLEEEKDDFAPIKGTLPLAALRATPEHRIRAHALPDDQEIARKAKIILDQLDAGSY